MDKLAVTDSPIVLVNMPFVSLPRPSLGLGILKAVLAGQGLAARVEYANLRWAHQVGLEAYAVVNSYPAPLLLGEWVFSGSVFPDFEPDHDAFLNSLDPVRGGLISSREEFVETAWSLRRQAGLFIDDLASEIVESGAKVVGCTSTFVQNLASAAQIPYEEDRTYKLDFDTVAEYGRYVKSLWEARGGQNNPTFCSRVPC
jgi:hypothetical protein